jgi:hypothetical protein
MRSAIAKGGPAYPVFLVLPQVQQTLSGLMTALEPVSTLATSARLLSVDVYYRASTATGLLALCFDAHLLTNDALGAIALHAGRAGTAFVDPSRLPDRARRRFHEQYLALYEIRRGGFGSIEEALGGLAAELATASVPSTAERVEVRFRRGDAWQLARLRSMTREGVAVATGTPPRRGDLVDLELSTVGITLETRGTVVGVALGDAAAALGASGFGARFLQGGEEQRHKLEEILRVLGADKLRSLDPPPRRRAARYPVRWPVFLRSPERRASLRALDVSRHGMFIGCDDEVAPGSEGPVHVTVPVDDGGTPVLATGRVARSIPRDLARARGLTAGIGIELVSLSQKDEQRFASFVARVGRRAERDVVVCASAERLPELMTGLTAAGYCTSGVSDARGLVARAAATSRVPDLVVLDASLVRENPRAVHAARRALTVRLVRLLAVDGERPATLRDSVDSQLL